MVAAQGHDQHDQNHVNMPQQTIGELINDLAQKAGVAADNEDLKTFLTDPILATSKVPESLSNSISSQLLSIAAAKNNHPEIKKVYTSQAYDGMDQYLFSILGSDTFEQSDLDEIKAEKNTTKKYELVIGKLKAAKANAKGADKEAINREIAAAHEAARLAKLENETLKTSHKTELENIRKSASLQAKYGSYKTIYDELDPAIKTATMEALINKALQDKNAELKVDDNGNLTLVGKDGSNVFGGNHVQLTPQSFLDQTLAPILKVSGPIKPVSTPQRPQTVNAAASASEQYTEASTDFIKSHTEQVLADMAKAGTAMI